MPVTHSQESCTSQLAQETCTSVAVSCTSFLHRIQHSSYCMQETRMHVTKTETSDWLAVTLRRCCCCQFVWTWQWRSVPGRWTVPAGSIHDLNTFTVPNSFTGTLPCNNQQQHATTTTTTTTTWNSYYNSNYHYYYYYSSESALQQPLTACNNYNNNYYSSFKLIYWSLAMQ